MRLSFHDAYAVPAPERRLAGAGIMVLVHLALIGCWQLARTAPSAPPDGDLPAMTWIRLAPPLVVRAPVALPVPQRASPRALPHASPSPAPVAAAQPEPDAAPAPVLSAAVPAAPSAAAILDNARRSVGAIDRALRKQNRPYIVAPPDSPELRLRAGMERAHDMVAPKLWEAPKVDELVNQTGDGARRTRVRTASGTYCISERSPATSVDMIETHGKLRLTNCPQHEDTATQQDWRTARGE